MAGPPHRLPTEQASFTHFVDFVLTNGTARVTKLAENKLHRNDVVTDFYLPVREALVEIHRHGVAAGPRYQALLAATGDARKVPIWQAIAKGHGKFLRGGPHAWFAPALGTIPASPELEIVVNPELGLVIGGRPTHVKLWLRAETLPQKRVDIVIALMARLRLPQENAQLAVLDVQRGALRYLSAASAEQAAWTRLGHLLAIEAAAYAEGWARL